MATSAHIRSQLVAALHSDLIGPSWDDVARRHEQLPQPPSVWYTTGFLVPHVFQQEAGRTTTDEQLSFSDLAGEEPSSDATHRLEKQETDDDANDALDQANTRRSWFTSSCGLSFILERGSTIEATVTWGDYTAPADGDDEPLWLRSPQRQSVTVTIPGEGSSKDRSPDIPLEASPQGLCLRWIARTAPSKLGYPSDQLSVSLFLLNKREPPKTNQIRYRDPVSAFQVELSLHCARGFPPRRDALQQAAKDPDERLAALQYRHDYCFASGHNVAVIASDIPDDNPARCHTLTTTWLPTARVYRTLPEPPPGTNVPMGMEALADLARSERIGQDLMPMVKAYRAWITQQPKHPISDNEQNETAKQLRAQAEACATRIENGIKLLADPLVREAFRTMNVVMARAQRQRSAFSAKVSPDQIGLAPNTRTPNWRFFQLAFVLMNLPGLATPETPDGQLDRETVELLFFPTGGGKTEAYLGLAAFLLVHRRLQSPGIESAGITVLMRYTLRLLTLDQLGRAATLICALELERLERIEKSDPYLLGEWPFEIGMWVGKAATPNKLGGPGDSDQQSTHAVLTKWKAGKRDRPIPIETCPWCNRPLQPDGFHLLPPRNPDRLEIYCREPRSPEAKQECAHMGPCPFHKGTPLPVLAVDEQIYRRLPCFLIATIDKFAALPWVGKTSSLFGNVSTYQLPTGSAAAGFWGPAEKGAGGLKIPHGRLLPPELVIQDELHLISGPLGTLAGLYESAIEGLMRPNPTSPPPKIIASTATVRRAEAQIKALFARSQVRIFPPPGPERDDNFFSRTIPDPDQARLYVGLSAPGRNLKGVLLRSYLGLMAAAQKAWNDNKAMGANNPADPYMTLLGYFSNLKELGVTRSILEDELGAQLEQFAKNRSLPMEGFENPFASRKRPYEPEELTSRVNTAKISSTKDRLAKPYIDKDHLDVTLATNMISVGLDISRLGLMVVLNQPKTAAEYIQATSRVGRQLSDNPEQNKPGLVLVLLNPNRPRDRSHFELFPYWHQTFYRHVEATSCTPFASRALDRGLPGVVVAMARHGDPALAGAKGAMAADALQRIKAQIAKALQDRCIATGAADDSLDEHLPNEVRDHVIDLLEAWWKLTQEDNMKLQYWTHEEKGAGLGLLHTALDTESTYKGEGYKQFTTNWSLRDVEPSAPIRMVNFREEITADD